MSGHAHDHDGDPGYEGDAVVLVGEREMRVRAYLTGFFQPVDGRFHWYGRLSANEEVTAAVAGRGKVECVIATPSGCAVGVLSDVDVWGRYRVEGVGSPPFPTYIEIAPAA